MVFVLDRNGRPLMPCTEKRARLLLARGRARVHRLLPFTVRVVDRKQADCTLQPLRLKLDPGSKTTGMALVRENPKDTIKQVAEVAVVNLFELIRRGRQISEALTARRQMRRRRRGQLRFRAPRFLNRGNKKSGWLAPSLQHRVDTTAAWVTRFRRLAPITALSSEVVRFDMQQMQNPEISGAEYQQGTLAGYEMREYLLEKWSRCCAYCDARNIPQREVISGWEKPTLAIKAMGRGSYQRTRLDRFGFPRGYLMRAKSIHGFQTGDMVKAVVPTGKKAGSHRGRVAIRQSGSFNITGAIGMVQGISHKHCRIVQRNDGYGYVLNRANHTGREQARPKASDAAQPAPYLPGLKAEVSRAI